MAFLLWTLLSILVKVLFIILCILGIKALKERLGTAAAVIFAVGLLSFSQVNKPAITLEQMPWDSTTFVRTPVITRSEAAAYVHAQEIEDYTASSLDMTVVFKSTGDEKRLVPVDVRFAFEGFLGGHTFEPTFVQVKPTTSPSAFRYDIFGYLRWNILGVNVFTQTKRKSGELKLAFYNPK